MSLASGMAWDDNEDTVFSESINNGTHAMRGNMVVSGCAVTENSPTPDLTVDIASGTIFINGALQSVGTQAEDLSTPYGTLTSGKSMYVYIYADTSGVTQQLSGTIADTGQQVPPDWKTNVPADAVLLAKVVLTFGDPHIHDSNDDIFDLRFFVPDEFYSAGDIRTAADLVLRSGTANDVSIVHSATTDRQVTLPDKDFIVADDAEFNTSSGHDHDGADSKKVAYSDLASIPSTFTPANHNLIDSTKHPVSGLTIGHFLKALSATTYGFAAHADSDHNFASGTQEMVVAAITCLNRDVAGAPDQGATTIQQANGTVTISATFGHTENFMPMVFASSASKTVTITDVECLIKSSGASSIGDVEFTLLRHGQGTGDTGTGIGASKTHSNISTTKTYLDCHNGGLPVTMNRGDYLRIDVSQYGFDAPITLYSFRITYSLPA